MSGKSSLCLRCAKVYVDNWVSQVSKMLHAGVIYRHIVLTVPVILRTTFYHNANVLLSAFMRCGLRCLDDVFSRVSGTEIKDGYIVVIQTHCRNGQYQPHLHFIATSGGWDYQGQQWVYRCSVGGEEMLVNEAIIDVAIGAAKFCGEYPGQIPTIGCPGCNGEAMADVAQEP